LAQFSSSSYNKEVNEAVSKDLASFDLNPELKKFRFPTLVITGRYDMNVAPVIAYRIHQSIPGSKFLVFEKSSHLPFTEEPEAFASAMEDFLQAK
ncbi:MAG: alpha/beta fold hydrolase, partial [Candidatus Acidiferrum sp.]